MRCPKCGYITFDRVERCGKCAHDLMAVAAELRGPMAKVAPPLFLGGLLRETAEVAEAEPATFDLEEEALDLGEAGEEGEALALDEEAPAAEEEVAIEMPSLSGIDVSDLMPPQDEAVELAAPDEEALPEEEEISGIAMPEMPMAEETAPEAAVDNGDDGLSPNFDLTGGETRANAELEAEEEAAGGVLDLADLLGTLPEEPAAGEVSAVGGGDEDDLSLLLEDESPAKSAAAPPEQLSLSLESSEPAASDEEALDLSLDDLAAPSPAASPATHTDIPDLGLTLESDDEDEKPAA